MHSNFNDIECVVFYVDSYMDRHQVQLFGRGHIGGIDIKVNLQCTVDNLLHDVCVELFWIQMSCSSSWPSSFYDAHVQDNSNTTRILKGNNCSHVETVKHTYSM